MSEHCIHETDIFAMQKDLYNDGKGIKYKVNTLWEQYYLNKGKRDMLLIVNSLILTVCSVLMVVITYKIL
jgi:hypothetical protein